jgi:hypothetical protein
MHSADAPGNVPGARHAMRPGSVRNASIPSKTPMQYA